MPAAAEGNRIRLVIVAMIIAGFAFTIFVFYPGIMTFDARYIYQYIAEGFYGDWQSPVMTWLWSMIDPIAPGPASILLLTVTLYWLAFALMAVTLARKNPRIALLLPLLALAPPVFVFLGIIWRDVLFAVSWLLAAALAFAAADRDRTILITAQAAALALVAFGFLIRPNALPAAPLLAAYILWPRSFSLKRAAILYMPAAIGLFGLMQVVYYDFLGAKRQHALHSVFVFDIGGISHFAKTNAFPGSWTADESRLITDRCYNPVLWDVYWTQQPCLFVMARLEGNKIFGTPALMDAWKNALTAHPLAYLQHRATFMWTFLTEPNVVMWTRDLNDQSKIAFVDNPRLMALKQLHDTLKPTPVFWSGTWLLLSIVVCFFGWRRRDTPAGAFALGICGAGIVYMMTYAAIGVATDFRYALWSVLASLIGAAVVAQPESEAAAR